LEKGKKVQKILALHQEDANREYERESGLINSIISYSVSDNMQIWYINADFIANLSIPHKCCTPNDFSLGWRIKNKTSYYYTSWD